LFPKVYTPFHRLGYVSRRRVLGVPVSMLPQRGSNEVQFAERREFFAQTLQSIISPEALCRSLAQVASDVDIVREGYDCVIRGGEIVDSDLIVRRLGLAKEATLASPAYLERRGTPHTIEQLHGHEMIGFASSRTFFRSNSQ
jgi:DNA-binding transcriptional LysR family regulator